MSPELLRVVWRILGACDCGRSHQDCYLSEDGAVEESDSLVSLQASGDEEDEEAAVYNQG